MSIVYRNGVPHSDGCNDDIDSDYSWGSGSILVQEHCTRCGYGNLFMLKVQHFQHVKFSKKCPDCGSFYAIGINIKGKKVQCFFRHIESRTVLWSNSLANSMLLNSMLEN